MLHLVRRLFLSGCLVFVLSFGLCAQVDSLRSGGAATLWGAIWPTPSASASLDAFVGYGDVEASSRTEYSLFPYTLGSETLSLGLVHDWLSLSAEYRWSLLPLGITEAAFRAHASPVPWDVPAGSLLLEFAAEGEARLLGAAFDSSPLRAEVWAQGRATVSRDLGAFDQVLLGATLEATLSSPNGDISPAPTLIVSASLGPVTLSSETALALHPEVHVTSETVSLRGSWREFGLSGELSLGLAEGSDGPSIGLTLSYEFGDAPLRPFPSTSECSGGVCR